MPDTRTFYRERRPAQRRFQTQHRLCSVKETASWIGCKENSLRDCRYRSRIGLAAIRVGGRLMFSEADIQDLIARNREELSLMPSGNEVSHVLE